MSDECSDVHVNGQRAELLPARTVLSTLAPGTAGGKGADGSKDPLGGLFFVHVPLLDKFIPGSGLGSGSSASDGSHGPAGDSSKGI